MFNRNNEGFYGLLHSKLHFHMIEAYGGLVTSQSLTFHEIFYNQLYDMVT